MADIENADTIFAEIQTRATSIISSHSKRDSLFEDMEQYWLAEWRDDPTRRKKHKDRATISPDASNELTGAWRLLTTTRPHISVPYDMNSPSSQAISSDIETAADIMWQAIGASRGLPLEKDMVLSALLYSEIHIGVMLVSDLVDSAAEEDKPYVEDLRKQTPAMLEVWNAKDGYPIFDNYGLRVYLRHYTCKQADFNELYPELAVTQMSELEKEIEVFDWYDRKYHCVWSQGAKTKGKKPENYLIEEHGYKRIPVIVQITEGSFLWDEPERQRRPWLYTLHQSRMWQRQNLALTALFNNVEQWATKPIWKHQRAPNQTTDLNLDLDSSVIELQNGEDVVPMLQKGAVDPALTFAVEYSEKKVTESTIYRQALGEPLGANAPFSMVALLHQAGRLPLSTNQVLTGWAIGRALELVFKLLKEAGEDFKVTSVDPDGAMRSKAISVKQIPDDVRFLVKLDVDVPTDQQTMTQAGSQALASGLGSRRWVRETLMNIQNSKAMDEEVWTEQASDLLFRQFMQQLITSQQAQAAPPIPKTETGTPGVTPEAIEAQAGPTPPGPTAPARQPYAAPTQGPAQ